MIQERIVDLPPNYLKRTGLFYAGLLAASAAIFIVVLKFGAGLTAATAIAPATVAAPRPVSVLPQVLIALAAVVAVGQVLSWLLAKIGQPAVIGEMAAGILLGPSLLGHALSARILAPAGAPTLGVISQFAVILYMYLVGLELNSRMLRSRLHANVAISHSSILLPFVLGSALALVLYPRLGDASVPFISFAMFLGLAMSVTAFPVLAYILRERGMSGTQLGATALGCAAADDVTAWCLLAVVTGVTQAQYGGTLTTALGALAYVAVMFFVARPLLKRLPRGNATTLSRPMQGLMFILLLLSALATEAIGIHAVFGAFVLGALTPHDSNVARLLPKQTEGVVVVLLLPAFFAFTGMRTEIGLLAGGAGWLLCGLIILVATVGKFGGSLLAARATGLSWREGSMLGILMNTRGLMELVVLNIGLDLGIISPTLFSMMVVMALVTTFATTPILDLLIRGDTTGAMKRPA
ncbi:MAG: cation:proton antiporter [Gemmatimonadales bacterium]